MTFNRNPLPVYLSRDDYRFLILGWCKYLIRPRVPPFTKLAYGSRVQLISDDTSYIVRVLGVQSYDCITEAVTERNYKSLVPSSEVMTLLGAQFSATRFIGGQHVKDYMKAHGKHPGVLVIKLDIDSDPKEDPDGIDIPWDNFVSHTSP